MGTYWKRWVGLVIFAVVLVTAFVRLGEWQLNRLETKRERNATVVAQQKAPVASFAEAFQGSITPDKQYRRVSVQGTFDPAHQLQVRYRTSDGRSGYEVVAPLRTTSGDWLLVDRGFTPRPASGPLPDAGSIPPPPSGVVTVEGYVMADETGPANATAPADGSVRLVNPPAIAAWSGLPLVDGYLNTTSTTPADGSGLVPVALPELTEGPHMSYAIQWFSFALIGVVGTFILIGKDAREIITGRRRRRAAGTDSPEDSGSGAEASRSVDSSVG
ncbi:Cytochrome oxidase assembly protein ShyY1 [Raineyella antarctica]|uniref:SURF1-like protein n=1 Tax=Raineyella antarctica TaxID=1577474 RepID=A0A1G6HA28_9ACTN|nr:SURF1 family protein [Raineyella antarctica]SDB90938.1 Cytochrome oxidase assembly protein ShyY1 [Raineyella antarctica]